MTADPEATADAYLTLGCDYIAVPYLSAEQLASLRGRGHALVETDLTSGLQVLMRVKDGWVGGADPRREGVVLGE